MAEKNIREQVIKRQSENLRAMEKIVTEMSEIVDHNPEKFGSPEMARLVRIEIGVRQLLCSILLERVMEARSWKS